MSSSFTNPAYAAIRVEGRRPADVLKMAAHNSRLMAVPNADLAMKNRSYVPMDEGSPLALLASLYNRLDELAIEPPGENRHVAFEAIMWFSPNADPMPPPDLLLSRGLEFFRRMFGQDPRAWWLHLDEKTPHLHAMGLPIVTGFTPGRPSLVTPRLPIQMVSWHQFSGAHKVNYRAPEKAVTKAQKARAALPRNTHNEWLAKVQTEWAETWKDYGLLRGQPSERPHRPPQWIRERTDHIADVTYRAKTALLDPEAWQDVSTRDLMALAKKPTPQEFGRLVVRLMNSHLEDYLARLEELAKRGVQLFDEQRARASLGAAHDALKADHATLTANLRRLEQENESLEKELSCLRPLAERPALDELADHVAALTDAEFQHVAEVRQSMRVAGEQPSERPRILPVPKVPSTAPNTDQGHQL